MKPDNVDGSRQVLAAEFANVLEGVCVPDVSSRVTQQDDIIGNENLSESLVYARLAKYFNLCRIGLLRLALGSVLQQLLLSSCLT